MLKGNEEMSLGSRLKIESKSMLVTSIFYAVAGIIFFVLLPMASFAPYLGIIGIFSLITAYGVFRKRSWVIWFVVILFFVGTTFSAFLIYSVVGMNFPLGMSALVYLVLTWIFTAYPLAKRKVLDK